MEISNNQQNNNVISLSELEGKVSANNEFWLCTCPSCGKKGKLSVSRKTGRYFCFRKNNCNISGTVLERTYRSKEQWENDVDNGTLHLGMSAENGCANTAKHLSKKHHAPHAGANQSADTNQSADAYRGLTDKALKAFQHNSIPILSDEDFHSTDNKTYLVGTIFLNAGQNTVENTFKALNREPKFMERLNPEECEMLKHVILSKEQWLAIEYFAEQHISILQAMACGVRVSIHQWEGTRQPTICYTNYLNGKVINVKQRSILRREDGTYEKKFMQTVRDSETLDRNLKPAPFNIGCINPTHLPPNKKVDLFITEGEKDALTLLSCGFDYVISVPNGTDSKADDYFAPFEGWLQLVKSVTVVPDMDHAGMKMKEDAVTYFGQRLPIRVIDIDAPYKDISEFHQALGTERTRQLINSTTPQLKGLANYQQLKENLYKILNNNYDRGLNLGAGEKTDAIMHLPSAGGLMVVTGRPGDGKSDYLNFLLTRAMVTLDCGMLWCSFEKGDINLHFHELIKVMMGIGTNNEILLDQDGLEQCIQFVEHHHQFIDTSTIDTTADGILAEADMVFQFFPFRFMVVDPYVYVTPDKDLTEQQSIGENLKKFRLWALQHQVWLIIVAHPTKVAHDAAPLTMYDVSGAANWANLADVMYTVKRNHVDDESDTTVVENVKCRFQHFSKLGKVYLARTDCGRYKEFDNETQAKEFSKKVLSNQSPYDEDFWLDENPKVEDENPKVEDEKPKVG